MALANFMCIAAVAVNRFLILLYNCYIELFNVLFVGI